MNKAMYMVIGAVLMVLMFTSAIAVITLTSRTEDKVNVIADKERLSTTDVVDKAVDLYQEKITEEEIRILMQDIEEMHQNILSDGKHLAQYKELQINFLHDVVNR